MRLYDLRHSSATLLLAHGVKAKVISERLGHADPAFTLRVYAHALQTMQQDATEQLGAALFGNKTASG